MFTYHEPSSSRNISKKVDSYEQMKSIADIHESVVLWSVIIIFCDDSG